ncbi:MAG TPA: multicopper oxidase domain-containing protein [Thermoplasmata archaeon]|nr:multicopper oxidase domain-containing protein [Thermoplasmata archaeon]
MKPSRKGILLVVSLTWALLAVSFAAPRAAAADVPISLYGSRAGGWGLTNTSLSIPGPELTVHVGDNVTLNLTSLDGLTHRWFIDYNGNNASNGGEPTSPNFGTAVVWNFTVSNVTGTYKYHSDRTGGPGDDLATMWGNITILPAGSTNPFLGGDNTVYVIAGSIVILVAVLAFAAFFWRRMKSPPPPPPEKT